MLNHVKIYFQYFDYTNQNEILCEVCTKPATDIHHIIPRSKFGSKRKAEQDNISNIMALCRQCHEYAHAEILTKQCLQNIHNVKINSGI